jgi:hypothetical protein
MFFISLVTLFRFSFAWTNSSQGSSIPQVARRSRSEREGPYPRGGVGYLWLAHLSRLAARACLNSLEAEVKSYLACFANFLRKMGPFLGGGMPPAVAPEGDLVF